MNCQEMNGLFERRTNILAKGGGGGFTSLSSPLLSLVVSHGVEFHVVPAPMSDVQKFGGMGREASDMPWKSWKAVAQLDG